MNHFFAIEVPEAVREEIAEQVERWRDLLGVSHAYRWVDPLDYHITLLFLGDINETGRERAIREALPVAEVTQPLTVTLAPPGVFRKGRTPDAVLWLGVRHSNALMDVAGQLRSSVRGGDVVAPLFSAKPRLQEQPYKPHVTLGRGAFPPDERGPMLTYERVFPKFTATRFVLMQTTPPETRRKDRPIRYNSVQTFPLGDTLSSPAPAHSDLGH